MALTACSSTTSGSASGSGSSVSSASADGSSSASSSSSSSPEGKADTSYASLLFDTSYVHTVDITISEADWADLKQNPLEKTKYKVDITIDGETVSEASFATKGNTSLSSVASDGDSDRYSFKVNFGKYIDDQTYHGLNKLNLNNAYADATYMKDYISYAIFRAAGVNAHWLAMCN